MNVVIRRAEARDVPRMLELVRELALFEKAPEAVTVTEEEMRDAGFGEKPVWVGWVAEGLTTMDHILGIALCYTRYSTWRGRVLYLEDIVVTEAARGRGIGDRLLRTCIAYAAENGYVRMRWQVLDWNEGAIRFYERFGAEFDAGWVNVELDREQLKAIAISR
ncbi:MAG: GNAT family N-acetyltransferase [Flavobacteriales bacterium]